MTILTHENYTEALDYVEQGGGTIYLRSYNSAVEYNTRTIKRWRKAGHWIIKPTMSAMAGDHFRVQQGKGSIHVFPAQLVYVPNTA